MDTQVEMMMVRCGECMGADKHLKTRNVPMTPVPFPEKPWEKIGMDILGPVNVLNVNMRYLIVLIDYHSKSIYTGFMRDPTTNAVISFLEQIFHVEGFPLSMITDNGVQFKSEIMRKFLRERGIRHYTTALYSPQGNGLVERANKIIKETIQLAVTARSDVA